MAKRGDAYQQAVAEVASALDPSARVDVSVWIESPDGRRDLDVAVRRSSEDPAPLVLIECKDWGRPIGIGAIDALESKRRDLGVSLAMICSNSGFTVAAIRKAARVGIPVLSALIEGDSRIRIEVEEEIFTKRINIARLDSTWQFLVPNAQELFGPGTTARDLLVDDRLAGAWVRDKAITFAATSAESRQVVVKYSFKEPVLLHVREIVVPAKGVDLTMNVTIQWCSQVVQIGASSGMYDYLRERVVFGPGAGQYLLKNVDFNKWSPLAHVPPELLTPPTPREREMVVCLAIVTGMDVYDDAPAPTLDLLVDRREITETRLD